MIFTFNEDWKLNKFIFYILVSIKMGNRLASSIQSVQLLAALVVESACESAKGLLVFCPLLHTRPLPDDQGPTPLRRRPHLR